MLEVHSDDPTEELVVDVTEEVPPVEDFGENNGPPLMWFGLAVVLLAGAVGLIVLIGQNREDTVADSATGATTTTSVETSPAETPPIGDPGASATDEFEATADTSPPDEASDEATSTDDASPATSTTSSTTSTSTETASADTDDGNETAPGSLIIGEPTITSSADDFEIMLTTSECTTVEWSFAGEGQAASYNSDESCFDEHLLSPRPEHPLQPATQYVVTASFVAGDDMEVVTLSVTTGR